VVAATLEREKEGEKGGEKKRGTVLDAFLLPLLP